MELDSLVTGRIRASNMRIERTSSLQEFTEEVLKDDFSSSSQQTVRSPSNSLFPDDNADDLRESSVVKSPSSFRIIDMWRGIEMAATADTMAEERALLRKLGAEVHGTQTFGGKETRDSDVLRGSDASDGAFVVYLNSPKSPLSQDPNDPNQVMDDQSTLLSPSQHSFGDRMLSVGQQFGREEHNEEIYGQGFEDKVSKKHDVLTSVPFTMKGLVVMLLVGAISATAALMVDLAIEGLSDFRATLHSQFVVHIPTLTTALTVTLSMAVPLINNSASDSKSCLDLIHKSEPKPDPIPQVHLLNSEYASEYVVPACWPSKPNTTSNYQVHRRKQNISTLSPQPPTVP